MNGQHELISVPQEYLLSKTNVIYLKKIFSFDKCGILSEVRKGEGAHKYVLP